jgi:glutamyl-tRNA reductase
VLVLGAGEVGRSAIRSIVSRGATIGLVARSNSRPDEIASALEDVDVVVSSTSAPGFVIERAQVEQAVRRRRGRPLFLIDLAVPRDLDPAIHKLGGCYLYDIDDLETIVVETLADRRREAERAEAIVAAESERFREWLASLDVVPAIASLRAHADEIRAAELRRAKLSDAERRAADSVTTAVLNKLLHLPTIRMKQAAAAAEGVIYADAVRHLFGLEDER